MTQAEFDAIPEEPSGFGMTEEVIDGKTIRRPVAPNLGALYHAPDDPAVSAIDHDGQRWMIGRVDGRLVKRRAF